MSGLKRRLVRTKQRSKIVAPDERRGVAVHEAGHVVMLELLGYGYDYVTVRHLGQGSGHVALSPSFEPSRDRAGTRRTAMVLMAGALAQWLVLGAQAADAAVSGAGSDLADAARLLRTITNDPGTVKPLLHETLDMLRENERAIRILAEALMARERLTRADVRLVLSGVALSRGALGS